METQLLHILERVLRPYQGACGLVQPVVEPGQQEAQRAALRQQRQRLQLGGITGWMVGWKRNGWKTADKKPVKNVDLWQRLDAALKAHQVRWHWVKGHAGHDENERADQLARDGVAMARLKG